MVLTTLVAEFKGGGNLELPSVGTVESALEMLIS